MADWKRPHSIPIPQIWSRFEGKKPVGKNGKIPKFKIQDMTDDMIEAVLDHMCTFYLKDEPKCQNENVIQDPVTVQEHRAVWRKVMDDRLTLVCLLENGEELRDDALPVFVGCNLTHWRHPNVKNPKMSSPWMRKFSEHLEKFRSCVNCFEYYNVPGYLSAYGLSVDPIYRGQGIGLELLKARFPLGRAVGIKLTVTLFSSVEAQRIAEKAGFETLYEIYYKDFKDENGEELFKGIKAESVKLMAARIE